MGCCNGNLRAAVRNSRRFKQSPRILVHLARQMKHLLAAQKIVLANMEKRSGVILKKSTILHATLLMHLRRVMKATSRDRDARGDSGGRENAIGSFNIILVAEYMQEQPKFCSMAGSGDRNEGHRAM